MRLRFVALGRSLLLTGGVFFSVAVPGVSQDMVTLRVEENVRREPNGVVLGRIGEGARLRALNTDGNWTQVEVEGWVWLRSLKISADSSFDLVVSQEGGENLRSGPSGFLVGVLAEGTLLEELGRNPGWARVARVGWIWSASLVEVQDPGPDMTLSNGTMNGSRDSQSTATDVARVPVDFARVRSVGAILAAPDGDTMGLVTSSGEVQVLERQGRWARVRLEGWVWMPETSSNKSGVDAGSREMALALRPEDLSSNPSEYAGRVVVWTIQFISLERAEAVRTDFFEGEPFLLTRFGGSEGQFVYVVVPTDLLSEVEGLVPLEIVELTGRVRTGASRLTGTPIIEMIEIQRF